MASNKREIHSEDISIEQKAAIIGLDHPEEIIEADPTVLKKEYMDEIAFNEEPVTIRLEPSAEKNAAKMVPIWNNGRGCEMVINNRWVSVTYIPVGQVVTIKRKYLATLVASKLDTITTDHSKVDNEGHPINTVNRFTSAFQSFSVLEDKNPRGAAWLTELRRRNM